MPKKLPLPCHFPAEWEHQQAVIVSWPHRHSDWKESLPAIESVYCHLAEKISALTRLLIIAYNDIHQEQIISCLATRHIDCTNISFYCIETNDIWVRDYGPLSLWQGEQLIAHNYCFNGWGGKYSAEKDNAVTQQLDAYRALPHDHLHAHPWVLEGGAIDSDGQGTLLARKSCVISDTRNPSLTQQAIEQHFKTHYQVHTVHWLEHGMLFGDDTDGHIDMLARFVSPQALCYSSSNRPDDPQHTPLKQMEAELQNLTQANGRPYTLWPLPIPEPCFDNNRRLPASYCNFLILNQHILVPQYQDPADAVALEQLSQCFPEYTLLPIDVRALITQNGAIHCATLNIPSPHSKGKR